MWTADPQRIAEARARIDPLFLDTPLRRSPALDRRFGAELLFKDETANPIRSFKGRGACNLVAQLPGSAPLVTASAGNFGQGMAWAARLAERRLTVFAAKNAVHSKVEAMRRLGAMVVLAGKDFDEAKDAGAAFAQAEGAAWIEDGAHAAIAEGAGTIAQEICDEREDLDVVVAPLGNGALAAGLGSWMRHFRPRATTVAVAASGAPAMALAVRNGTIISTPATDTIADGIAVRVPIPAAVHAVRDVVEDVVLVDDSHILEAMGLLLGELGVIAEPAGAAGFAALIAQPERWRAKRIAIPVCGGNI